MTMQIRPADKTVMKGVLSATGTFKELKPAVNLEQLLVSEKIRIKQHNTAVSCHSIIWPWDFPAELKTELTAKGQIIRLQPREKLNDFDMRRIQLAFLVQGSVKLVSSIPGLKHRILDLYFPGENLALSQNDADGLSPKLEAITDSFIYVLSKKHFFSLCRSYPELFDFSSYLKDITLIKTQRQQLVLANFSAETKLSSFLVNACRKLKLNTRRPSELKLAFSRVDISDYLNMSPETLCRSLQNLHTQGLIQSTKNKIIILNYQALLHG